MQLWPFAAPNQRPGTEQETDVLDEHASLLLAGDLAGARALRRAQPATLAGLMLLGEHLAAAYQPVALSESKREWLLQLILGNVPGRRQRLSAAMRGRGREAMLGAALVGTAFSLGRVALYFYRRRQVDMATAA